MTTAYGVTALAVALKRITLSRTENECDRIKVIQSQQMSKTGRRTENAAAFSYFPPLYPGFSIVDQRKSGVYGRNAV
jgi:hypothetical protein